MRSPVAAAVAKSKGIAAPVPAAGNRISPEKLRSLKRDLGKLEQTILEVQTRKHAAEAQLAGSPSAQQIAELGRELHRLEEALNAHEENWLLLSEEIEAATVG